MNQNEPKRKFTSFFDNNTSGDNTRQVNELQKQLTLLERRVKLLEDKLKKGNK
jgi:hypothetical protein